MGFSVELKTVMNFVLGFHNRSPPLIIVLSQREEGSDEVKRRGKR